MSGVDELVAFLRAALDRDEQVALEASRSEWLDGHTPTGEHWHWVETDNDEPQQLDPMLDGYLNEAGAVALRSIEEYPTGNPWMLPHFVISGTEEMRTVDAMHIARWDPARVLAEVQAKRRILDMVAPGDYIGGYGEAYVHVVHELAQPYAGQPGWREEWDA